MLCKKSVVLVLDANILAEILLIQKQNLNRAVMDWLKQTVQTMDCQSTEKKIILAVSTEVLKDYSTGLSHRYKSGNMVATVREFFKTSSGRSSPVHTERGIDLVIKQLQIHKLQRRIIRDKFDQKYLELAHAARKYKNDDSHHVIVATQDMTAYDDLYKNLYNESNTTVVANISQLEDAIRC